MIITKSSEDKLATFYDDGAILVRNAVIRHCYLGVPTSGRFVPQKFVVWAHLPSETHLRASADLREVVRSLAGAADIHPDHQFIQDAVSAGRPEFPDGYILLAKSQRQPATDFDRSACQGDTVDLLIRPFLHRGDATGVFADLVGVYRPGFYREVGA